jgi:hypothetical protein
MKKVDNAADVLKNGFGSGADITWTFLRLTDSAALAAEGSLLQFSRNLFNSDIKRG